MRIILDRNRNGLDGRPRVPAGRPIGVGVYWDEAERRVEIVEAPRPADREYVLLSERPDVTFDELVRLLAMGGGGRSGQAVPYHAGASNSHHQALNERTSPGSARAAPLSAPYRSRS